MNALVLDHLTEYLRAGWAKAVASSTATAEEKTTGSLKGTLLVYLEDHGPDALLDYAQDYTAALAALHGHPATPKATKTDLGRQLACMDVVLAHLREAE